MMGAMHHALGMEHSIEQKMERERLLEEGKFRKLSEQELEGSNEEIAKRIEAKRKSSSETVNTLVRLHLVGQGFSDGSEHKGD